MKRLPEFFWITLPVNGILNAGTWMYMHYHVHPEALSDLSAGVCAFTGTLFAPWALTLFRSFRRWAIASIQLSVSQICSNRVDRCAPPKLGELMLCLVFAAPSHSERLGDFEDIYRTIWFPRFGKAVSDGVYVAAVLRAAVQFRWVAGLGAVVDVAARVLRSH